MAKRIDKETFFQQFAELEDTIEVAVKRPDGLMLGSVISAEIDEDTGKPVSVSIVSRLTLEGADLDQILCTIDEEGKQTTWLPSARKLQRVK